MRIPQRARRAIRSLASPPALWIGKKTLSPSFLRYGWNNDSFAADADYLRLIIRLVGQTSGPILECGSGITTILLSELCRRTARPFLALEHMKEWCERVGRFSPAAVLIHAPLRSYGEFDWYEIPDRTPRQIGLVICDGPPGRTKGGRYGALPLLQPYLAHPATLLLDDAERAEEKAMLLRWKVESGVGVEIVPSGRAASAIVTIP